MIQTLKKFFYGLLGDLEYCGLIGNIELVLQGKDTRDRSLQELVKHICNAFIPLQRKWMILFPEGGFLRKRREASQRYADKNNLPVLQNVTIPRIGAMKAIMNVMCPEEEATTTDTTDNTDNDLTETGNNNETKKFICPSK